MGLFKPKAIKVDAHSKVVNGKLLMWIFIILGALFLILTVLLKSAWWIFILLAVAALAAAIGCKLIILNRIQPIRTDTAIQFAGAPGSGKSFFMAREASRLIHKQNWLCAVNERFVHYSLADFVCKKKDLGHKDLGDHTLLLWDEGNLDGFDNRDAGRNFADNKTLQFFLLHRQNGNPLMFTSQGVESLDKKIREDVITTLYWCDRLSFAGIDICVARKLHRVQSINDLTGKPEITYEMAAVREAFLQKDAWLVGVPRFQARGLYRTINRMSFDRGSFLDELPMPDAPLVPPDTAPEAPAS